MIVVDSSVWINHLRNITSPEVMFFRSTRHRNDLLAGDLIVLEVLRGARDEKEAAVLTDGFREMGIVAMLNDSLAVRAANHYRRLRTLGITVSKTVDLVIATFCIANGLRLLHQDRDFIPFERHLGLKVVAP